MKQLKNVLYFEQVLRFSIGIFPALQMCKALRTSQLTGFERFQLSFSTEISTGNVDNFS